MTFEVAPEQTGVGGGYTLRVTGCATAPTVSVSVQLQDVVTAVELSTDEGGGSWSTGGRVGPTDMAFRFDPGQCGPPGPTVEEVIDVENPVIEPGPIEASTFTELYGTDCPVGTTAAITVVHQGTVVDEATEAIDVRGDWTFALPTDLGPGEVEVRARCGTVVYPTYRYVVPGEVGPPAAPVPGPPPVAPPAQPLPTEARFTG